MNPTHHADLIATLRESATASPVCRPCRKLLLELTHAVGDHAALARKAAQDTRDKDWDRLLARVSGFMDDKARDGEGHLAEPHADKVEAAPKPAPKPAKADDKVPCPACGKRLNVRADGRFRVHQSPRGVTCSRRWLTPPTFELPPVDLPDAPSGRERAPGLPVTGHCHGCDRQVSGERRYCGRCAAKRDSRVAS